MAVWSIDVGTTNTGLCRWDPEQERATLVVLPEICRDPRGDDPLQAPGVVPSATHMVEEQDVWTRLGRLPFVSRRVFWGRHAIIGRPAVERNLTRIHPAFVPGFKAHLQHQALRPIARVGKTTYTARDVARAFLRELLAEVERVTDERIREITVTAPVDAYEGYRAELRALFKELGVKVDRFVDEPVAAAAGYGLSVRGRRNVLVVDMGGGTTDLALIEIDARSVESGTGRVLAKAGRAVAGDLVDRWVLHEVCEELGTRVPDDPFWERLLLDEARWVKEQIFLKDSEPFHLRPPGELASAEAARMGGLRELVVTRERLVEVLDRRGLYAMLADCTDEVLERGRAEGLSADGPDDVLMVGGSTLLPGVFPYFEQRFGRDRVRAWQPFQAVVSGACTLSARGFAPSDYIVHEYAIVIYDQATGERKTTTIIPAGTRFPTKPDLWRRHLVPTCALGEPERIFKLVICEIGRAPEKERSFGWDEAGQLHKLDAQGSLVVPLNEANPALGFLDPPHQPGDRTPRLDVRFGVDEDRWLVATVVDLKSNKVLMNGEPVVRLL
ncbi:MAG: Hsp70 family protein [Myxococcales bacterium]|nr:Hsp70 family protein [Myxococcales bacterium]